MMLGEEVQSMEKYPSAMCKNRVGGNLIQCKECKGWVIRIWVHKIDCLMVHQHSGH